VGYVDLRRRQEERARGRRENAHPWHDVGHNPYFFSTIGFGLAIPASWLSFFMFIYGAPLPVAAAPLMPSTVFVLLCVWQLRDQRPQSGKPGAGGEKQLLMAIRDAGGSITAIEAALETSLTVDEAEEILSRFADRGHLLVESRDGTLYYVLPGRRSSREVR
jgi:hypothetical protein